MKETALIEYLQQKGKIAIAYSGGIDSTYLMCVARDVLGRDNVLAVIVDSILIKPSEIERAKQLADHYDVRSQVIWIDELSNQYIRNNHPKTWYYSKKMMYQAIRQCAEKQGFLEISDGMIMDDLSDYRPGLIARREENIQSPLQAAGLYKKDVRAFAKKRQLVNWAQASSCSLCSRFMYHTEITPEMIQQVIDGEAFLTQLGFEQVRVRHHQVLAKIEVALSDLEKVMMNRERIHSYFQSIGFSYVALDLSGYETGKMNRTL